MGLRSSDQASSTVVHELIEPAELPAASGSMREAASGAATNPASPTVVAPRPDASDSGGWLPRSPTAFDSGSYIRRFESQGREENRSAALSYFPPVMLAYFLGRRASPYLRFHAAQGLALTLVALALVIARWLVFGALDSVQSLAMVFFEIGLTWVFGLVCLALVALWLWGIVAALAGKDTVLPLVGRLAQRIIVVAAGRAA